MKVNELIELLKAEDQDREVICQKDPEGNGFSPFSSFWIGKYRADTTWSGEAGMESLTDEDRKCGYTDEDIMVDGVKALFLVPIN